MKGKHGVSAEARHRIETLEAEAAKLRHGLGRTEKERDALAETLRQREIAHADERRGLMAHLDAGTSPQVTNLKQMLAQEQADRQEDVEEYARLVFQVVEDYKAKAATKGFLEALADVFGMSSQVGELIDPTGPRRARRAKSRTLRVIRDMKAAPEWVFAGTNLEH